MKRAVLTFFAGLLFLFSKGQESPANRRFLDPATGSLLYIFQATDIQGSQFLYDKWMNAQVMLDDNSVFKNLQVKFDVYNNKFIVNKHDTAFEITPFVKEVLLYPSPDTSLVFIYRKGFSLGSAVNNKTYLQVLNEGSVQLLKYVKKDLEEYSDYGNASKLKRFAQIERYFVGTNGQYKTVNLSKDALQNVSSDKWPVVSDFITKNKLNVKTEEGWRMAITYYNNL